MLSKLKGCFRKLRSKKANNNSRANNNSNRRSKRANRKANNNLITKRTNALKRKMSRQNYKTKASEMRRKVTRRRRGLRGGGCISNGQRTCYKTSECCNSGTYKCRGGRCETGQTS